MTIEEVQIEINNMLDVDLQKRKELVEKGTLFDGYHPEMEAIHIANSKRLEQIIADFGYPTEDRVGKEVAAATWTIVMHSISNPPFMKKVLTLLKSRDYLNEIDPQELAYLEDRVLVFEGKPQIFGTQFDWDEDGLLSPYPIENPDQVNELREKIGLLSIEEQTVVMRQRALAEGEKPPKKYSLRLKEMDVWAKKVGWRGKCGKET